MSSRATACAQASAVKKAVGEIEINKHFEIKKQGMESLFFYAIFSGRIRQCGFRG